MKDFNLKQLRSIGRVEDGFFKVAMMPAFVVYLLMATLLVVFVLPSLGEEPLLMGAAMGALMGFCVYGVFDLTNLAILRSYPIPFALVDVIWGTFLFSITTVAVRYFA
jgi:uncharacterized membrane protein